MPALSWKDVLESKKYLIFFWICLLGFFWRLKVRRQNAFWTDEIYQFNCMKGAFKPFWLHQNYGDHTSFPGEYLLNYPFVRIFGWNKWALTIPHLVIMALGFWLLFKVCQQYLKSWMGWLMAALVFTCNQTLITHALEFRPYSVLPIVALAALYYSRQLIEAPETVSKFWVGALFIFIMSYHAYGLCILLLPLIFVICTRSGPAQVPWKFLIIVLGIGGAIWYWYASYNNLGFQANTSAQSIRETFQYIPDPLIKPVEFLKIVIGNLVGSKMLGIVLLGILVDAFLPSSRWYQQVLLVVLLIIFPIILIFVTDYRSRYWFLQRQFIWVIPFFALWTGMAWDNLYLRFVKKDGSPTV